MHELSLMKNLIKKISDLSKQQGGRKITRMEFSKGAFCQLNTQHFESHIYELAAPWLHKNFSMVIVEGGIEDTENLSDIVLNQVFFQQDIHEEDHTDSL